jgi:hypothetical protein
MDQVIAMAFQPSYKPSLWRQIWLPATLILLALLTLPAVVLLILHLFGGNIELNDWLRDNFQLTYRVWPDPPLALALLLVPIGIVLLYFLRLKRKALQVPSTFLWRKSIEDLHVNSLFQWLRENVLLLLQVLTVLFLIFAVMGFAFHGSTSKGKYYIVILDNSASMATKDVQPSRLEWAKEEALKLIDEQGDDNIGMVISFNSKATTLQAYTKNRTKLRDAVLSVQQTNNSTRLDEALSLADSLANNPRSTEDQAAQPEEPIEPGKERDYVPVKGTPTEVYLFSDGGFPELSESSLSKMYSHKAGNTSTLGNLQLHFQMAGAAGSDNVNNVGIVAFNVGPVDATHKKANLRRLQAFVQVRNYRPQSAEVKLVLEVESNGKRIHNGQQTLSLPRRTVTRVRVENDKDVDKTFEKIVKDEPGDARVIFDLPAINTSDNTVLKAYLKDVNDDFDRDDVAWVVLGSVRKSKVMVVTPGNPALKAFFDQEAALKVSTATYLTPADLTKDAYLNTARSGDFDLVIFDRCMPAKEEDMPAANTFCIDQPPQPWLRGTKVLKHPVLIVSKKEHPLLRDLTELYKVGVFEYFRFDLKDNLSPNVREDFLGGGDKKPATRALPALTRLLEAPGDLPLLFTLPRGHYTDLVMTFPLELDDGDFNTDWPVKPSFALFLHNVLFVLGNVRDADRENTVQPGEPMILRPEADIKSLTIVPPKGSAQRLQRSGRPEFIFTNTAQLGVYQVERDDGSVRSFAVNLLDPNESNIEPRSELKIGSDAVVAGQERRQPRELWKWITVGALILLLLEWYIYNRRIYV